MLRKVMVLSLFFLPVSALAQAPNRTPNSDASMTCSCTCGSRTDIGLTALKQWSFSGTRAECQAFSGAACSFTQTNGVTRLSSLFGCDVIVVRPIEPVGPAQQFQLMPRLLLPGTN